MATPTGTTPGCICPTATCPLPSPTASAENPWAPSTVSIWVGSIGGVLILIFTILYAICKEAAWTRAKLYELNKDILAVLQKGVDTPEQQWMLDLLILERKQCARGYWKYLHWANGYTEPSMPMTIGPGEAIALARLDKLKHKFRDLVARQQATQSSPRVTQSPPRSSLRRRNERSSLSWLDDTPT